MYEPIPLQTLTHNNEIVFFAYRSMEENYLRTGGKPDVPHKHDFYTIIIVRKGSGKHYIDYFKPGVIFTLNPGQVHQVISFGQPEGDIIMFNDEFMHLNYINSSFISDIGLFSCGSSIPPIHADEENLKKLSYYAGEIKAAFQSDNQFRFDVIASYLKLFLIDCNKYAVASKAENPQALESGRSIVRNFKDLLDKNYYRWHQVNMYANQLNITPDYLNNIIKSNIGKSAKELIIDRIILEAKRLGLHTEMTVKEIAYRLGYDDPSHFSKLFKNETGQPFSDFRIKLVETIK